ncbi:MAG: hypothetical protein WC091_09415 [Sulfuricellaceae bacterium]
MGAARRRIILLAVLCSVMAGQASAAQAEITPADVYAQAVQIEKEVELLKRHYHITAQASAAPVEAELQPRHVWQKAHLIQVKLDIFRTRHGLPSLSPVTLQPLLRVDPRLPWAQTQRILSEIRIIKRLLGIPGEVSPVAAVPGKRPIDNFNKLNRISYDLDTLNGEAITPSYVYTEAMRFHEDLTALLRRLEIPDTAAPPPKPVNVSPKESLKAAFALMNEVQRIQRLAGLDKVDFKAFDKAEDVAPSDVFNMVSMCLAELQVLKAKQGMTRDLTPLAEHHEGKTPSDVAQLLGYSVNRLRLIRKL